MLATVEWCNTVAKEQVPKKNRGLEGDPEAGPPLWGFAPTWERRDTRNIKSVSGGGGGYKKDRYLKKKKKFFFICGL